SAIDLHKWLVAFVKPICPWYYEVSKCAPQQALRNLRKAFDDFFKKKKGFPKFKKKGEGDSFYLEGSIKFESNRIKLPKIGWVKTFERLPTGIKPKNVVVSRHADRWLVSFRIETEPMLTPKFVDVVGVDLGVKVLATLSTGEVFEGAKSYKKLESKLSRLQYLNRKKTLRSKNWQKATRQIAKLHRRIANLRKDTLHKLTTYLAKNHSQIVIEDLNVSGMMANHKLAKAVGDMGFYEFRRQLEYKTQLYGSELLIADRWFPSSKTCSNCGTIKESLLLCERTFICDDCGFTLDRDLNASINLRKLAGSLPVSACGSESADTSEVKQELNGKPR
ncbi:MAG: RNA-guided endonuclease TnpB family protein, partial [Lyngbya sp.]|nr:RNA-guided endonuclease TnpB family protein [Lyngbya sp.]